MPLLILLPAIAVAGWFGYKAGNGVEKAVKWIVIGGVVYYVAANGLHKKLVG